MGTTHREPDPQIITTLITRVIITTFDSSGKQGTSHKELDLDYHIC